MRRAVWFVALAALAQDPAGTLEKAREKILPKLTRLPQMVCVETIDRRYFARGDRMGPAPPCETISIDRKKGRNPPMLGYTDRVRVAVTLTQDREIYSWTGREPVSYSVEDILHPGPIGTGGFAGHLLDIFTNPAVQFRLLEEGPETLEYGFRVPIEGSHYSVGAGGEWVATGYGGSFRIERESQNISRFTVQTNELPPETSMCETSSVLEFGDGAGRFVPTTSTAHDVMRDASETDSVTTISDCGEATATPPRRPSAGPPLAAGILLSLVVDTPFDSDLTAAGDTISATISEAHVEGTKDAELAWLLGATVRGRIARVEHRLPSLFAFSVAFETLDVKGVVSPFYAKLIHSPPFALSPVAKKSTYPPPSGHGRRDWSATFMFDSRASHYILRAPFESKWLTTAPDAAN
jgi:hypothetical protein